MVKNCDNCNYSDLLSGYEPCRSCEVPIDGDPTNWKAAVWSGMTNADHIRTMSDADLGKWLCGLIDCYNEKCPAIYMCSKGDNGLVKWLQQPWRGDE